VYRISKLTETAIVDIAREIDIYVRYLGEFG
jgi:hypothetical protein